MEEDAQQRITFLLEEIDANICAAHRSATQICTTVRRHHHILRQIHESAQVWRPLFNSFTVQPAASRRPTMTPARSAMKPRDSTSSFEDESMDDTARNLSFSDAEMEEAELPSEDHQEFKTTTLQNLGSERTTDKSLSVSINSENLPSMKRTPYATAARGQNGSKQQGSESMLSENTTNWTPSVSSPPRTELVKGREYSRPTTPPSAISSIAPASPQINKNLMKIGAFEYTPPKSKTGAAPADEFDVDQVADMSLTSPALPVFTTVGLPESFSRASQDGDAVMHSEGKEEDAVHETTPGSAMQRKRRRPGSPQLETSTARQNVTPNRKPSPSMSTPNSYTSLRRKYSSAGGYSTPQRSPAKTVESIKKASQDLARNAESPMTPPMDMPSPLLRTQLKAMTPLTPLSNRLVGADLDAGSTSQEAKLQDYDDSFNSGDPVPEFSLSLFPSAFQRGVGAVQISSLYSKFKREGDAESPALSVAQLSELLPSYDRERIYILLDTLVSRRLLRPFVVEGVMFWQIPV